MSTDLSKLLVLEAALEHLLKVNPQEPLEYIDDMTSLPKDTRLVRTDRGAIGYYPSEIGQHHPDKMEEDIKSTRAEQGVAVSRDELEPEDETREISGVTAEPLPSETTDEPEAEDTFEFVPERTSMQSQTDVNDYFDNVALYLDAYLQQELGSDFKPYLGKSVDANLLNIDEVQKAGFTDGSKEGVGEPTGLGINSFANWTVTIEGQPFIYKLVHGDNQAEVLSYTFDRALGLNVVPYVKQHSIGLTKLKSKIESTQHIDEGIVEYMFPMAEHTLESKGSVAGGHFQEYCDNCLGREESIPAMAQMLATVEGREEFFKVLLLDFVTGNDDRHTGNYLITKDNKIVAIDNGLGGRAEQMLEHQANKSIKTTEWNDKGVDPMSFPYMMAHELRDVVGTKELLKISDQSALVGEAEAIFDKYFTKERKAILDKALNMSVWSIDVGEDKDFSKLKGAFAKHAANNLASGMVGHGTGSFDFPLTAVTPLDDISPDFDWEKTYSVESPLNIYEEDEFN